MESDMDIEKNRDKLRSSQILSIRPTLNLESDSSLAHEKFQNEVLRPILKFQNDLLVSFFQNSKQFQQQIKKIDTSNSAHYEVGLRDFLKRNNHFRNKCLGLILGMMTVEELKMYMVEEAEYKRRILGMLVKRIQDQL